jgi:protein tyrosine phosphatase (PTP) superfamily phosphohydrolase (DUF442 family)
MRYDAWKCITFKLFAPYFVSGHLMADYHLTWITSHLAVGHAPMSYSELDSLKDQGIDAIVNLCGEFSDLHEIEEKAGFEVLFLPVEDENAPAIEAMEAGLAWLDEALYLGKKVLVHCRHGIGRTGTFVSAYLLRRGFTMKQAAKMLKATRANPTNFPQWWLLRKYGKKEGRLTVQEPTPDNRNRDDLEPFFRRYEQLLTILDQTGNGEADSDCGEPRRCGGGGDCANRQELELIEALYLHTRASIALTNEKRRKLIDNTVAGPPPATDQQDHVRSVMPAAGNGCPLYQGAACLLHQFRPLSCRLREVELPEGTRQDLQRSLEQLSMEVFAAIFGRTIEQPPPRVRLPEVVNGRFIQDYFQLLLRQ